MTMFHASKRLVQPERTDLVTATGTFCATEGGILTKLNPPLARLSGYFPWKFAPGGLAALRLLTRAGEPDWIDPGRVETVRRIETMLKLTEDDCRADPVARRSFQEDDRWVHDVELVVRWGVGLASKCPDPIAARELARLQHMPIGELDHYVRGWLPGG